MKLVLDSHNVEVTDAIKEHVQICVDKLEHMNQRAVEARVHLERIMLVCPQTSLSAPSICISREADLFAEDYERPLRIDRRGHKKIQAQLRKRHNKIITRHHSGVEGQGGVAGGQCLMGFC